MRYFLEEISSLLDTAVSQNFIDVLILVISAYIIGSYIRVKAPRDFVLGKMANILFQGIKFVFDKSWVLGQSIYSKLDKLNRTSAIHKEPEVQKDWSKHVRFFSKFLREENREAILGDLTERMNTIEENNYSRLTIWHELIVEILGLFLSNIYHSLKDYFSKGEKEVDK